MQTFDSELERLINAGQIDKELGLSYATNRTNLQLRLETQGGHDTPAKEEPKSAPSFAGLMGRPGSSPGGPRQAAPKSEFDDLIER
jgi:hypothetical protein